MKTRIKTLGAALVALLVLGHQPDAQADEPPTRRVVLAALADGGLAVVDPERGIQLGRIEGLSDATFGIALDPQNPRRAWAVGEKVGLLFELDLMTWAVKGKPISLSGTGRSVVAHQPVLSPDGRFVIVSVPGDDTLTLVNTRTRAVSKIAVPDRPHIVSVDPRTGHLFVSCRGARPGVTFVDLSALRQRLSDGAHIDASQVESLGSAYVTVDMKEVPRVVTAIGQRRFAVAVYGKRGPLVYEVGAKPVLLDDLDALVRERPRAAKPNREYLEAQAISGDGRTLVGTDQGTQPCLRVWTLDPKGRGVEERARIPLPLEPYWVQVSTDGSTAWVSLHRQRDRQGREVTGRVLTVDLRTNQIVHSVPIDDDGGLHCPKRLVVVDLPERWLAGLTRR